MTFYEIEPVQRFNFSDNTVMQFTTGECWFLALALQARTGLPVAAICSDEGIQHVGLQLTNGNVVDIEGVWNSSDWEIRWIEEMSEIWGVCYGEPTMEDENYREAVEAYTGIGDPLEEYRYGNVTLTQVCDQIIPLLNLSKVNA